MPRREAFSSPIAGVMFPEVLRSQGHGDMETASEESEFQSQFNDKSAVCSGTSYLTSLSFRGLIGNVVMIGKPHRTFGSIE